MPYKDKICGVYMIECKINKKKYVGSSSSLKARRNNHKNTLLRGENGNRYLQKDYNEFKKLKYFKFVILEIYDSNIITLKYLREREQFYIDKYKSYEREFGYNITPKADGSKHAEETIELHKLRISENHFSGYKPSLEVRKGRSIRMLGNKLAVGLQYWKGKRHTQESKEKMSRVKRKYNAYINEWRLLKTLGYSNKNIEDIYGIKSKIVGKCIRTYPKD